MADGRSGNGSGVAVDPLRALIELGTFTGESDQRLLESFHGSRSPGAERAFAGLVERHGPMVLGVCRRLLRNRNDADDAFQAVFLVLARRAGSIQRPSLLGPWLHGVAAKVCRKLKARAAVRTAREEEGDPVVIEQPSPTLDPRLAAQRHEEAQIVHEEIARLPERYRRAVVLCELQGLTHTEAARAIGCPSGTVSARITRARHILHGKLIRRGLAPAVATAAISSLQPRAALAAIPPVLQQATISAALAFALGQGIAIPSVAASLARAVLGARRAVGLLAGTIALGAVAIVGAGMYAAERGAAPPRPTPVTSAPPQPRPQPQAQAPQPVAPSLPQAVTSPPDWLGKDVPFDVNAFFAAPPPDDNAAPLYLDAFFEFDPEMAVCFPDDDERKRRKKAVKERLNRYEQYDSKQWTNPKDVTAEDVDQIVAEFEPGFLKLAAAQERPRCVFQPGLGITARIPHTTATRRVVRIMQLRVTRELERGELNRALNDIARLLRLARDLRPQACLISMMGSLSMESNAIDTMVMPILHHPSLTVSHCDRLLEILRSHEAESIDPYPESVKAEYLIRRATLYDLVHHQDRLRAEWESFGTPATPSLTASIAEPQMMTMLAGNAPIKPPPLTERLRRAAEQMMSLRNVPDLDELMSEMPDDAMARQVASINEFTREELALDPLPYVERLKRMKTPTKLFSETDIYTRVARQLTVSGARESAVRAFAAGIAHVRNAQALVCVRRWQLTHNSATPVSLEDANRAAGLEKPLIDPYINEPVRLTMSNGQPVAYCVGPDGDDDLAQKNAQRTPNDGDELLWLPKR